MILEKFLHSLTGKLILTIGTMMIFGSFIFWYFLIRHQETKLINYSKQYGYQFTDYVKKSTRFGMLTFQGQLIQQTIEAISSAEAIVNLRIFDNVGKIAYSSDKSEIGTSFDLNSPLCTECHKADEHPKNTPFSNISKGRDSRILNIVQPIYNEPSCYAAACHAHSADQKILGLIEADLSLALLDKSIQQQGIAITIYVIAFIFILSVVLGAIFWRFVTTPLRSLTQGMKRVASGDLNHQVPIITRDEIGELAKAFNSMTTDLKKTKSDHDELLHTLEQKVQEKTETIKKAQAQLIHSEKLASLGRMAAGVAHEINSPLTGIITFGHLLEKKIPAGSEERKDLDVILEQANSCSNIIQGLLGFARASTAEKALINVNDIIDSALNIVRNKSDFFNITIVTEFDESLPTVKADVLQLQQVFLNMIMNAADAVEGKGTITAATRTIKDNGNEYVEIEFMDTGSGISEENLERLFEPFFTTKPVGKGTGLGLAISHGIIQEHGGKIFVKSKLGEGSSFFVWLPVEKEAS